MADNDGQWERGLIEKLATAALKEQRRARLWGIFWKLLTFAYVTVVIVLAFIHVGGFSYRGYTIHVGAMFGTIMAANVWMRIWPAQRQIITATKEGNPPDAALVALAGSRSRHNTYMSVPLVWAMINSHTTTFPGSWVGLCVMILLGWGAVNLLYKKAAQVPGF